MSQKNGFDSMTLVSGATNMTSREQSCLGVPGRLLFTVITSSSYFPVVVRQNDSTSGAVEPRSAKGIILVGFDG